MNIELTMIDALLALAIVVIVPAAIPLHPLGDRTAATTAAASALPAAGALLIDRSAAASLLVVPWLAATALGALAAARWWWPRRKQPSAAIWAAAAGYLAFGAAWLAADRLGATPAGFVPPFVQLTAVHFHYAGFIAAVIAASAWRHQPTSRTAATAAALIVSGPPVVAVGFVVSGPLQIVGAVLLTAGLWLYAWVSIRHIAPHLQPAPAVLIIASAIATLVPMAMAVQWAVGNNYNTPALSIPSMVHTHGTINAIGFSLLGTIGWRLALHTDPTGPPSPTRR